MQHFLVVYYGTYPSHVLLRDERLVGCSLVYAVPLENNAFITSVCVQQFELF